MIFYGKSTNTQPNEYAVVGVQAAMPKKQEYSAPSEPKESVIGRAKKLFDKFFD